MQILYSPKFFALTAFGFCSSSLCMEIVISVVLVSWVDILLDILAGNTNLWMKVENRGSIFFSYRFTSMYCYFHIITVYFE